MASVEFSPGPPAPRVSDADRERALDVLRESLVEGRVSEDTFERRTERVLMARWLNELHAALSDLPYREPRGPLAARRPGGWLVETVTRVATFQQRLRLAWQAQRLPQLVLPAPGPTPLSIGRATGSALRLTDASVSRHHAHLLSTGVGWLLRDLGSSNGTWVNGRRVVDALPVGPGDQVRFGAVSFRLAARELPA
jgi:hypothetical protein